MAPRSTHAMCSSSVIKYRLFRVREFSAGYLFRRILTFLYPKQSVPKQHALLLLFSGQRALKSLFSK